ncbi:MAG: Rpn family recombination-promoting nuclease/putative transposase [Muribaculaceae bacterium]
MSTYINPMTDFGFKYIFGREESKDFLIDFLNNLLKDEPGFDTIIDLQYLDKEKSRRRKRERG